MAEAKAGRPRKYDDPKEAQKIASQKWKEKNKERANFNRAKSAARSFIRNKASNDDLDELQQLINDRREQLK